MLNILHSRSRGRFLSVVLGLTALMVFLGFSGVYAGDLLVYTALEDDEVAVYLPAFKKAHPDINVTIYRDSTGIVTAKLLAEKDNPQADVVWGTAATSLLIAVDPGNPSPFLLPWFEGRRIRSESRFLRRPGSA